jgi:hypothetical protein
MISRRSTSLAVGVVAAVALGLVPAGASAPAGAADGTPGGESAGDSLFPTIGNTGYDVRHYGISLRYARATGRIAATTAITARATKPLSSFSLDLEGLHVHRVVVDGRAASFRRHDDKLVVTPYRTVRGLFTSLFDDWLYVARRPLGY